MPSTPYRSLTRRSFGVFVLASAGAASAAGRPRIVTMLGDSITAGLGLAAQDAVPARLQEELIKRGLPVIVRAAGVSGDTSAGGLSRVDFSVQPDTEVCVVALGGNDLLQELDPKDTRANLGRIIQRLKARRITVVLAGLRAPPVIGRAYATEFDGVYKGLAAQYGVALYPNLLDGVAGDPTLNQRDRIHPNAKGARIIAARIAPTVAKVLAARS